MIHFRFTFLTVTLFSLTVAPLFAEETPATKEPLQVLEDCIKAAEAGDFARYVEHLSTDEQQVQAGYILFMTRIMSHSFDVGISIADPEMFLMAKSMRDLVAQYTVPETERGAEYQAAVQALALLTGEASPAGAGGYQGSRTIYGVGVQRKKLMKSSGVLSDARRFLVAALADLARPTEISGAEVPESDTFFNCERIIKEAKDLKWTLYARGEYALAVALKPEGSSEPPRVGPYSTAVAAETQPQIEFMRIDTRWKITRLLPASVIERRNQLANF